MGEPLWGAGRAGGMLWLQFGERRTVPSLLGRTREVGAYALHVSSAAWRLSDARRILVASGDRFTPAGPGVDPDAFEWDEPGANLSDVRWRAFLEQTAAAPPAVAGVTADALGGFRLSLARGFTFEAFPAHSHAEHEVREFWRLLPAGEGPHFVVESAGVDRGG